MKKIMFGILFLAVIMISSCSPEMSPKDRSLQLNIPSSSSGSIEGLSTCYTAHGIRVDSQNSGGHSGSSWEFYSNRDINDDGTIRGNEFCRYENLHLMGNSGECVFGYVNIYDPATDMKTSAIYPCHDGLTMEELVLPGEGSLSYNAVCCV
jgi:hypothetical protein